MKVGDIIDVNDKMKTNHSYELSAPIGKDVPERFQPFYAPKEMLAMGVFEGKYCNDCVAEFPEDWLQSAKLNDTPDPSLNYFGIKSRKPLSVWRQRVGSMVPTQEAGSNGTAGISWEGGSPKSTISRSSVGEHLRDTPVKSVRIVIQATSSVGDVRGKRFCSGPMIR